MLTKEVEGKMHNWILSGILRLLRMIPGKRILAKIPCVRKTYILLSCFFLPHEMILEVMGHKMYVAPIDNEGTRMFLIENPTLYNGKTKIFQELIERGTTVVEIGAHFGYHSLILAKLVGPEGKVFAFEPEPKNFSLLQRNVGLSGYTNVTLVNKGIYNKSGLEKLYLSDKGRYSLFPSDGTNDWILISTISLDEFFSEDIAIDFIHINIEGSEGKALQGMQRILSEGNIKAMVIDFHPEPLRRSGYSFKELWDKLEAFGFEIYETKNKRRRIGLNEAISIAYKRGAGISFLCTRKIEREAEEAGFVKSPGCYSDQK